MSSCLKKADKILILGGTGLLGSAMTHYFVQNLEIAPSKIRIFYLPNTPTESLKDISGLDMFPGNILNYEDVKNAFQNVEYVFHLVGNTSFEPRIKALQWKINVEGTRNVLEAYRESKWIKKMVYTSTVNTLGIPNPYGAIGDFENSNPYTNKPKIHTFNSPEDALAFADFARNSKDNRWVKKIGVCYFDSKLTAQELVNKYIKDYGLNIVSVLPGTMFGSYDYLIGSGMYVISIYNGMMPGVLKGGFPLMHVMDSVEGHILAMDKAQAGSRYIITGMTEDNRTIKDMAGIIASVLQEKCPDRKIKAPKFIFPKPLAYIGAFFMEIISSILKKSNPLSRDSIKGGTVPSFYTYKKAETELGYIPKRTFKQAIGEMFDYYKENNLLDQKERFVDKIKK